MRGSPAEARAYALKLLGYRSRSKKEMIERLKRKGFGDDQIRDAISFLEKFNLIDDEALASELLRYSVEIKSLGKNGIKTFLYKQGLERELIDETLSAHTEDRDQQTALEFVDKKLSTLRGYPPEVVKRRLWGMLQRRGFSSGVIRKAVESAGLG